MNYASLNNLWTYLQGLTLTAGNKRWLADHLNESAKEENASSTFTQKCSDAERIRKEREEALWAEMPRVNKEDLKPSQEVLDIVKDVKPMSDDIDIEKIKYEHFMKKYG